MSGIRQKAARPARKRRFPGSNLGNLIAGEHVAEQHGPLAVERTSRICLMGRRSVRLVLKASLFSEMAPGLF